MKWRIVVIVAIGGVFSASIAPGLLSFTVARSFALGNCVICVQER